MATTTSVKSKPLWRTTLLLPIIAAVFTAVYKVMDNITVHNFIVANDGLTAAFSYLILGGWVGFVCSLGFATMFGRTLVDPDFRGINPKVMLNKQAIVTGVISAGSTLFLLWGNQMGDPSAMIALGSAVVLYTAAIDVYKHRTTVGQILPSALLVLVGSGLAAYGGGPIQMTLMGILFVLVISNGLTALSEFVEQAGTIASDGVNFFVWRFAWLAASGTVLAFVVSAARGKLDLLLATMSAGVPYLPWIALTMLFVFLGIGMKLVSKKHISVSVVLVASSVALFMGYPLTILGNYLSPGIFGDNSVTELWIWGVRILGSGLMVWAVYRLR